MVNVEVTIWRGLVTGVEAINGSSQPLEVHIIDEDDDTEEIYKFPPKEKHGKQVRRTDV